MKNIKLHSEETQEYPLHKARAILEADGTFMAEDELREFVKILTLLAKNEAELLKQKRA